MILLWKGTSAPVAPLKEGQGGNAPLSVVPAQTQYIAI